MPATTAPTDASPAAMSRALGDLAAAADRLTGAGLCEALGLIADRLAAERVEPEAGGRDEPAGGSGEEPAADDALLASVGALEQMRWRIDAERLRRIGAFERRRTRLRYGAASTASLLAARSPSSYGQLRREVADAAALQALPRTAARLAEGELDPRHVRTAADADGRLAADDTLAEDPEALGATRAELDDLIADHGPGATVAGLRQRVGTWEAERDDPSQEERETRAHERRGINLTGPSGALGMGRIHGDLDPHTLALLRTLFDGLAQPHGAQDDRSAEQRRADALAEAARRTLGWPSVDGGDRPGDDAAAPAADGVGTPDERGETGASPSRGPRPRAMGHPHLLLIASTGALAGNDDAEPPELVGYGAVSQAMAQRIACDADVTVLRWRADGTLNVGRRQRKPTRRLRAAVLARDRSCIGCKAPATRCEIHHVQWVRHEALIDREGCKDPPLSCRSRAVKLEAA
ncbi:MAG: DUF222 domain-containing protein [Egibacteraceae bacterium]